MKTATIVGAGLVGSLWAVYLSKAGYDVRVVEMRGDLRKVDMSAGKSINLAFSERGWKAFRTMGIESEVEKIGIPMYGRTMHDLAGNLTFQPYGQEGQAIFSISRGGINARLMDIAEKSGKCEIFYHEKCIDAQLDEGVVVLKNTKSGKRTEIKSDVVFATDGAFSAVRYKAMQKQDRFNYEQRYIPDGYREILLPAGPGGSYKLEKNTLHIWPRGRFMLIALPNEDGSFTCTLFMPHTGHTQAFDQLGSKSDVQNFFKETFPDFFEIMPEVADVWEDHPLSSLAIIRCFPWTKGKFALMGDAAHATVPFYGQGMNAGFEDCTVMWSLMNKYNENWEKIFSEYELLRKPEGDAVQDLSLDNYYVMRDYVGKPEFLLQKKFERRIQFLYPGKYTPLYSQVTFGTIPYSEAYKNGKEQEKYISKIMAENNIAALFASNEIDQLIHKYFG